MKPSHAVLLIVLVLTASTIPAIAQQTKPAADTPDEAAARAVAKAFVSALGEEDPAKVKALFHGSPEDAKSVDQMHAAVRALTRLAVASKKRWPDAKNLNAEEMTSAGMSAKIAAQPIRLKDDEATFPDGPRLKKVNGTWQVIDLFPDPQVKPMLKGMFIEILAVVDQTLPEIEQGKFKSAEEAETALQERMSKRMKERMALPPATKPAK